MTRLEYRGTPLELYVSGQIDRISKANEPLFKRTKLKTGFKGIDDVLLGLHNSCLYLLASHPEKGKTALLINVLINISKKNTKALFVTPKMAACRVAVRVISCVTGISMHHISNGDVDEKDLILIEKFRSKYETVERNLLCMDYPEPTVEGIRNYLYSLKENERPKIIVIDDVNELKSFKRDFSKSDSNIIMLELMKMAQEFEIPVLVSATIERSIKSDEFSFLQLRDLYNCCLYEQYASVIMFLENPIYYDTKLDTMSEINGVVNLRISKNEIGNLGVIKMVPKLSIQKFCDYSHPII